MSFFLENMAESLLVLGLLLLVVEVLVLGFSTFFLFFVGIGLISTALIFFSGAIDSTAMNALISVSIISFLSTAFLWKPLQKMHETAEVIPVKSDLIGYRFTLESSLNKGMHVDHQYSGINWKVSSGVDLLQGEEVEVIEVSVGKMSVKPVSS